METSPRKNKSSRHGERNRRRRVNKTCKYIESDARPSCADKSDGRKAESQ
jgi:hypothetical protein